ncbi:hypothetical protein QOZ80_1AG0040150 [Eleusine coracana subsp. coracana]|nr:hypothetical protein QOZ80_1AG0040150 [Eleusine coracana subsp. coracana]
MQSSLLSGRRRVSPLPAPQSGQRRLRRRGSDTRDRISDLPNDLLLNVLKCLNSARQAARTSVLSRRWSELWSEIRHSRDSSCPELRKLVFDRGGADEIKVALDGVSDKINYLKIAPDSKPVSSLLRAADRLAPADLVISLKRDPIKPIGFQLPCFASATSIKLVIERFKCNLPAGEFASLEQLNLEFERYTVDLGVLLPLCPRLRKLKMCARAPWTIGAIAVRSNSLKEVEFNVFTSGRGCVDIVAPQLKKLILNFEVDEFTLSHSLPKLEEFHFELSYRTYWVGFSKKKWAKWRSNEWRLSKFKMEPARWSDTNGTPVRIYIDPLSVDQH